LKSSRSVSNLKVANNGLLSIPPNRQPANQTNGGTAASQTLNEIKNKLNHINQNNTQINISK